MLTVHGTDVELARRAPAVFRPLVRAARVVTCVSESLVDTVRRLGARTIRVVPVGINVPARVASPDDPPHVLFVGRLSEEKGVLDLLEAARGLPLVVVGDGPLRERVKDAVGFVPPSQVGGFLDRAAIVVCPSRREGYGVVAREAMAHGRPVVATAVGGLAEAVLDGETGLLVAPGDVGGLRAALEQLLADASLRTQLGSKGRERAARLYGRDGAAEAMLEVYAAALDERR